MICVNLNTKTTHEKRVYPHWNIIMKMIKKMPIEHFIDASERGRGGGELAQPALLEMLLFVVQLNSRHRIRHKSTELHILHQTSCILVSCQNWSFFPLSSLLPKCRECAWNIYTHFFRKYKQRVGGGKRANEFRTHFQSSSTSSSH